MHYPWHAWLLAFFSFCFGGRTLHVFVPRGVQKLVVVFFLRSIFWLAFFIIATIICIIGWAVQHKSDEITTSNTFNGHPSLLPCGMGDLATYRCCMYRCRLFWVTGDESMQAMDL